MNTISLKDSQNFITQDKYRVFKVMRGNLLIYITEVNNDDTLGRKHFFLEVKFQEDLWIPSLSVNDEEIGKWKFQFLALSEAELVYTYVKTDKELNDIIAVFSDYAKVKAATLSEFEQEIVEIVERRLVAEELSIFRTRQIAKESEYQVSKYIYQIFNKSSHIPEKISNNPLYNAVSIICKKNKINLASYETMVEACGKNFGLEDLARISHFMIREVHLEDSWYKNASGDFLIYKEYKEGGYFLPVACMLGKDMKYTEYNPQDLTSRVVDKNLHNTYVKTGYMIYKPLPAKELSLTDVFIFCKGALLKRDITLIVVLTMISSLIGLFLPFLQRLIYDKYTLHGNQNALIQIGFMVLSLTIGNVLFSIVKNLAVFRSTKGMEVTLLSAVLDRLYHMPDTLYQHYESVDLVKRAMSITEILKCFYQEVFISLVSLPFAVFYLFYMFASSAKLAFIGLFVIVIHFSLVFFIGHIKVKLEREQIELNTQSSSLMYQAISGIDKIKIAGAESRIIKKYSKPFIESVKLQSKEQMVTNILRNLDLYSGTIYTVIFYGLTMNFSLDFSPGNIIAFITSFGIFSSSILSFVECINKLQEKKPYYIKAKVLFHTPPESKEDYQIVGKLKGKIELNNVSFQYSENEGQVISNVTFTVNEGEYIGIVGPSGSGKSTLLKLLLGFEKPTGGKIYYDDKDIDLLDKQELRKRIGVVLQDGQLINGSIYDNIVIASTAATKEEKIKEMEQVQRIVKEVGLDKDLECMPMKLETLISENSASISGGQMQRILIARALFNNPTVLFFDEATSALDSESQKIVMDSLNKIKATRIVIAHRLSTIEDCDKILVMDNGKIVEMGTYKELMNQCGYFYKMAIRQIA